MVTPILILYNISSPVRSISAKATLNDASSFDEKNFETCCSCMDVFRMYVVDAQATEAVLCTHHVTSRRDVWCYTTMTHQLFFLARAQTRYGGIGIF